MELGRCACGSDVEEDRIDSVYPLNRERTKWNVVCQVHNCGCGRIVYSDTLESAIKRWNNGEWDEYDK